MRNIVYIVEGETEQRLIETLKTDLICIRAGKIIKHNVIQDLVRKNKFMKYNAGTLFVLVFDTDTDGAAILRENVRIISCMPNAAGVILIPQVKNLEDELCYSCDIRDIRTLTGSKTIKDFKRDLLNISNLGTKLKAVGFSISRLWARIPSGEFEGIENNSARIKL